MRAERHRRVKELFLAACELGEEERNAFLGRECGADGELRREVEQLLGVDATGVPVLERPAVATEDVPPAAGPQPERLAPEEVERLAARGSARCYELEEELGRGGMGRILRARDVDLRRDLAMKVSLGWRARRGSSGGAADATLAAARFLEEARTTARLDHPGIVPVHDLGVDGEGRLFFTMKLVEGRELGEVLRLARRGEQGWTTTRVAGVLQKVCEAVAFAHTKGVVHRDLKPANVMVGDYGEVYVMDWGISRVLGGDDGGPAATEGAGEAPGGSGGAGGADGTGESGGSAALTRAGAILGTPYGMPPEQARGEPVGPSADVYAVGAMLYQALAGRRPYERGERDERSEPGEVGPPRPEPAALVLARILAGPPEPLRALAPKAPPELVAIAERAMAPRPDERYADMRALADDLRAYLEGRVVRAHRTGALAELRKWVARNRLAAAGLACALLAVVGGLLWSRQVETRGRREVDLASDYFRARVLRDSADELWPASPATLPALDDWIAGAELLIARRGLHGERVRRLEADPASDPTELGRERALAGYLDELEGTDGRAGLLAGIQARRAFASTIEERSIGAPDVAERWRAASAAVLAGETCAEYAGLELAPQLGLVPLGFDPESGLLELAHLETGEPAERGPDGRLAVRPETGLVLVLLPGGTFHLGAERAASAPNFDPAADQNEGPVQEVTLGPFLLSKFEMTQAQWERATGANPSRWPAGQDPSLTPTNPVEQVSWDDAARILGRMGLVLPTEARWEYACRAGTDTPFCIDPEAPELFANVGDQAYQRSFRPSYPVEPFDDGFGYHAPVGSLEPNPFGLHDVHGNVFEWVLDVYASQDHPRAPGDGRSLAGEPGVLGTWASPDYRVIRGGSFEIPLHYARASHRVNFSPGMIHHATGLRPARELDPPRQR